MVLVLPEVMGGEWTGADGTISRRSNPIHPSVISPIRYSTEERIVRVNDD